MTATTTKSVNMKYSALYSYIINTNYRSFSGVMALLLSFAAYVILIVCWKQLATNQRVVFLLVGLIFTVINPLMLAFKAFKQFKLSPSYKVPLVYTFSDEGILVEQGELSQMLKWEHICRLLMTEHMLAIYTGRLHAFVIPLSELGTEKGKIITSVVQFTSQYHPRLSKNLKRFQSGKGL